MALRIADDDPSLNPGQKHSDSQFNNLKKAESEGSTGQSGSFDSSEDIKSAEESPSGGWQNNVSGKTSPAKSVRGFGILKKKGPMALIITVLVGGGFGIATLLSPSLLIVQIKEIMADKFNVQLTSMDLRTTNILVKKMGTTSGICGSTISIACKYSTMSAKQIANFEKAGIKVNSDSKTLILGRSKPTSFEFNGETINPNEFSSKIKSNPEFRSALKTAYNPKFAGFADSIWKKAASKLGISKAKVNIEGDTDADKLKSIQEDTKEAIPDVDKIETPEKVAEGQEKPGGGTYSAEEAAAINQKIDTSNAANSIADGAKEVSETGVKAGGLKGTITSTALNSLKITGLADNACTGYGVIQALAFAAKSVRALQLAKFAMLFLNVADQIKAGVAKPEDVSYLGKILTTEVAADTSKGTSAVKSATDSFGYKYAAYGEAGTMPRSASQFLAGGGLTGDLSSVTGYINKILGNSPKTACKVLKNPFIGAASAVAGIASLFTGVGVIRLLADAALSSTIAFAVSSIPDMLKDIVAGVLVDKTTVGELAGDAITSGASGMMGTTAGLGGNAPLTPSQASSYNNLSNDVAAQYSEEERIGANPLDITNSSTFLGSFVSSLIPYATKLSSLSGTLSSIASLTSKSFSSIFSQTAKASSSYDYSMCQDYDYKALGLATDPYCNVSYGIPPEDLDIDPLTVINELINIPDPSNNSTIPQIDSETGDPLPNSAYSKFIENCINRNRPLGDSGPEFQESDGSECMYGKDYLIRDAVKVGKITYPAIYLNNKYFYIHYIDQRVTKGMDGEDSVLAAAEESGQTGISFFDNYETTAYNAGGQQ